jgi:hypothetical protein
MELVHRPDLRGVATEFFVTREARIIGIATIKFDGNPVNF